jgi:phosphotransferase system enzyme I (PtsI)
MSPSALVGVRAELRRFTLAQAQEFAQLALTANSANEARAAVFEARTSSNTNPTQKVE